MDTTPVANLRVAARDIAVRSVRRGLRRRAHAPIMKRALHNVTLALRNTSGLVLPELLCDLQLPQLPLV